MFGQNGRMQTWESHDAAMRPQQWRSMIRLVHESHARRRLLSLNIISPFSRTIIIFVFGPDVHSYDAAAQQEEPIDFPRFSFSFVRVASSGNEGAHVHNIISIVRTKNHSIVQRSPNAHTHTRSHHRRHDVPTTESVQHFPHGNFKAVIVEAGNKMQ